jgi:biotin carboxylase
MRLATLQPFHEQHVLLLGPTDDYLKRCCREPVACTVLTENARLTAWQRRQLAHDNIADFTDFEDLLSRAMHVHSRRRIDAVVSFTEFGVLPAALIASALQVRGPDVRATLHCRNKQLMRERLKNVGNEVRYRVVADMRELRECFADFGEDIIVKPVNGTGSFGVARLRAIDIDRFAAAFPLLAEQFIDGKEYSCEVFSCGGKHRLLAVTEKHLGGRTGFVEVGHTIHCDDRCLSQAQIQELFEVLSALGIRDGCSHTEVKIRNGEMHVIESHNRPGGDRIWQLVELARGFDMIAATVALALGRFDNIAELEHACAAIRYFEFPDGTVKAIGHSLRQGESGLQWFELPLQPGNRVRPFNNSSDRYGGYIVAGADAAELARNMHAVAQSVIVDIV